MIPIEKNKQDLQSLCKKHKVDKLYLFGSATNESFTESSDLDFLVRFHKIELAQYFGNYMTFKEKLKKLFKREIDLVEEQALKNPILINAINQNKELLYG